MDVCVWVLPGNCTNDNRRNLVLQLPVLLVLLLRLLSPHVVDVHVAAVPLLFYGWRGCLCEVRWSFPFCSNEIQTVAITYIRFTVAACFSPLLPVGYCGLSACLSQQQQHRSSPLCCSSAVKHLNLFDVAYSLESQGHLLRKFSSSGSERQPKKSCWNSQ